MMKLEPKVENERDPFIDNTCRKSWSKAGPEWDGEPIPYKPDFSAITANGLTVKEIEMDEFLQERERAAALRVCASNDGEPSAPIVEVVE